MAFTTMPCPKLRVWQPPKTPLLLLAAVVACVAIDFQTKVFSAENTKRPNIVFILADDLGYAELGCYGQKKIRTPNIDSLAKQGMRFTQHYSGAPVCAPSRNCLLTGLHTGHTTIRGNMQMKDANGKGIEGQQPIPTDALTIATVMKQTGYATGAIGKWGLGPVGSTGDPNKHGFDLFYGYNCQAVAHSYYPEYLWRNDKKEIINPKPIPGHSKKVDGPVNMDDYIGEKYAPEMMEVEAAKFIEAHAQEPFFLYLAFVEPHVAMHPPKRLVESYPVEWDDKPYLGQSGYLPHPRPRAGYAAMVTALDEHVGKVLETLKRLHLDDNTLVIFTSDNGTTHRMTDPVYGVGGVDAAFFNSVGPLKGFKGQTYEGGIRVPLLARWPGKIKPGTENNFASYFPDHFATLCDVIQASPAGKRDGISLLQTLTGQGTQAPRNPLVWVFPEYGGQVAVRIGDFKVLRRGLARKKPDDWEVYNIAADPSETRNLATEQADKIEQAKEILKREISENKLFPLTVPGVNDKTS